MANMYCLADIKRGKVSGLSKLGIKTQEVS